MKTKLHRATLAEQVAQALVEQIDTAQLKPGDPLPSTAELASQFEVSRPVIREALKSLQGRGIIDVTNGKSAVVKPLSGDMLRVFFQRAISMERGTLLELLEVRRGIEIQCALLAARRRTAEELTQMQVIVGKMAEQLHNPAAYVELDYDLHLHIATATHNRVMYYLIESIREATKDTIREGLRHRLTSDQIQRVQEAHEAIVRQIETQSPEGAAAAMAEHFDDAIRVVFDAEG